MDLKKINLKQIRDFSRTSPIYFSLGFTLLVALLNQVFSNVFLLKNWFPNAELTFNPL